MMEYKKNCFAWMGQSQSHTQVMNDRVLLLLQLLLYLLKSLMIVQNRIQPPYTL